MIYYKQNSSTEEELYNHILRCDDNFHPKLSSRVDIKVYVKKIYINALKFEAMSNEQLIGVIACYFNFNTSIGFISNVSVESSFQGCGVAGKLLDNCINYASISNLERLELEVNKNNAGALRLYESRGFKREKSNNGIIRMVKFIGENMRNFDEEIKDLSNHKYAYSFDFDVMHRFMIRSFEPFFKEGNLMELGSFKGAFTNRLTKYFDDITCLEASKEAIDFARVKLGNSINFIHSTFESVNLNRKFDNIVFTHVLEHLDNPTYVLSRINNEWLSEKGRLLLVAPNANAPSRQIAVKMGIIPYNQAVTESEFQHGHRRTYSLDTLERDVKASGLKIVHRSGIFFKAFANFQWDKILATDIITDEYLEGCYELGQAYPDLCASIFLVCEKG